MIYTFFLQDDRGNLSSKVNGISSTICLGSILCSLCFFGESLEEEVVNYTIMIRNTMCNKIKQYKSSLLHFMIGVKWQS